MGEYLNRYHNIGHQTDSVPAVSKGKETEKLDLKVAMFPSVIF